MKNNQHAKTALVGNAQNIQQLNPFADFNESY